MKFLPEAIIAGAALLFHATGAAAAYPYDPHHTLLGELRTVTARATDTLIELAREFDLGYEELVTANPDLDPWVPGEGSRVMLPSRFILPAASFRGIYINLAEARLYYYPVSGDAGAQVVTYPVSIGRGDWQTPVAQARVVDKIIAPAWYPPPSVRREHLLAGDPLPRMVPPGEDNPLGRYALKLNLPGYFIHGTNRPWAIGMKVTHGCIRLRPSDIEYFFDLVPRDTPVTIQYRPFKSALLNGVVYFEAHGGGEPKVTDRHLGAAIAELTALVGDRPIRIDWKRLLQVAQQGLGIPVPLNPGAEVEARPVTRNSGYLRARATPDYLF